MNKNDLIAPLIFYIYFKFILKKFSKEKMKNWINIFKNKKNDDSDIGDIYLSNSFKSDNDDQIQNNE